MTELNWKSAAKLVKGFAKKKFSPVEVAKACLAQIERHEKSLNAMVEIRSDEAMAMAKASEKRWLKGEPQGPVDGVPTLIKDLLLVRGWPTCVAPEP
jgi:aspartyl-tRNA(Asn)/glutamyl-tRNA(Gln) amidotransferase subunit A